LSGSSPSLGPQRFSRSRNLDCNWCFHTCSRIQFWEKYRARNPEKVEYKELTLEEHKKEGNQQLIGCVIGVILIAEFTRLMMR